MKKIAFLANSGTFTVMFINAHCPCKQIKLLKMMLVIKLSGLGLVVRSGAAGTGQ